MNHNNQSADYKQTEIGVIPEDWEVKELGEIGEVKMCKRIFNNETFSNGDIPFFKIGTFGKTPDAFITKEKYIEFKSKFSFPKKGEVLISAAGTIGRTVVYNGLDSYFQDSNIVWISNDETLTLNSYLKYVLKIVQYNTEGGTIQRLYNSILKSAKYANPPLPEQEKIAEALSDADAWISSLEQLLAKKRLIKQGAMQKLLTQKEGWEEKKLGEVVKIAKSGGTPLSSNKTYYGGNIPFLSISDMTEQGKFLRTTEKTITEEGLVNSASWLVPKDSIIYSMYASVGLVSINKIDLATSQAVLNLILKEDYDLEFFYYYLSSLQQSVLKYVGEGTQKNLNAQAVKNFDLKIPSLQEQTRIATILSDMDSELDALEAQLAKARQLKQGMMQVLLTGKVRLG